MPNQKKKIITNSIPLFIQKLSTILEDSTCQQYIQWTTLGQAFNIKDISSVTNIVLPKYFKHNNFSSFIRQLNMYGFNKIRHNQGDNVYHNQYFNKYHKQSFNNIKRKITHPDKQDKLALYHPIDTTLGKQLFDLKNKQLNLQTICKQLIDQNNLILEQNNMLMKRLATEQKQKNTKMEQLLVSLIMARGTNQLALPSTNQQSRALTLTNQIKPDIETNFQAFREFLQDSNGITRLQEALRKYQNDQKKRKKSKNFTIVTPNDPQPLKPPLSLKNQGQPPQHKKSKKQSNTSTTNQKLPQLQQYLNLDSNSHNTPSHPVLL